MKFAFDTYRDVVGQDKNRRVHALFTFALWFAAGGYLFSSLGEYIALFEPTLSSIVGGVITSIVVAAIKLS